MLQQYQRIMVAVDGSSESELAFKKFRDGRITVVKVPGLGCWRLDKLDEAGLKAILMGK